MTAPNATNVVVLVMENRDYDRVIGNRDAPYTDNVLVPQAALMTDSHAVGHPSQPNYLALFSGSTQSIRNDSCPHSFSAQNLGAELLAAGDTFTGYAAPDADGSDRIPTLLIGPMIRPGEYSQHISHYNVLRTIEDIFNLPCIANACGARPLEKMWR